MNHARVIKLLRTAEAVSSIEFLLTITDQGEPRFGCRQWDGLSLMGRVRAEKFVAQLNTAIGPVKQALLDELNSQIRIVVSDEQSK